MANQDARKDESMNPVAEPLSADEYADIDKRVQRYLALSRSDIASRIAEVTEDGTGLIDPSERRENYLELVALQAALEVKRREEKRRRKQEKNHGSNRPRVSNSAA